MFEAVAAKIDDVVLDCADVCGLVFASLVSGVASQVGIVGPLDPEIGQRRDKLPGKRSCLMAQDEAADVATLVDILFVIELLHERVETVACLGRAVVVMRRSGREAESRYRWRDDMECRYGRVRRSREEVDDLRDFEERAWPAMYEQQRNRIDSFGSMVYEVEWDVVSVVRVWGLNCCGELLQFGVDGGLFREPVVVVEPVVAERGEVGERWSFGVGGFVASWEDRRTSIGNALSDVVNEARFDVDGEWRW